MAGGSRVICRDRAADAAAPGADRRTRTARYGVALPALVYAIALLFGSTLAAIAPILAFLALDYFSIPPRHSLEIETPEHVVALLVYFGIAVVTGRLVATEADRKRQIERERERSAMLAQSDELKSALLAAVSHELRTPLATIKASSSALLNQRVTWDAESQHELLEVIDEEADRLEDVVGNLLDLSRIEGGALRPNKEWCDIEELVQDVAARLEETDERSSDCGLPGFRLATLLPRLCRNCASARQFGRQCDQVHPGRHAGSTRSTSGRRRLKLLVVHDDGPGLPSDELERLFEPFWRAERPGKSAGVGIGLTISRGLVEAHGGTIGVESAADTGTTFTVRLPKDGTE
ncbi:MAG: histidine kinase dimerization/phospho-acceptor domain-containing protein [Thermomicrobiales bacterium]